MKHFIRISLQLALVAALSSNLAAKSFHGIVPLHSTRTDIEKLWGKPKPPPGDSGRAYTLNDNRSIYFTDEGEVYVLYARSTTGCDKRVSPDTVLWVSLTLNPKLPLSELRIEEKRFRTYDPAKPEGSGFLAYSDDVDGFTILTFKGLVEQIFYQPTAEERKICPWYFERGAPIPFQIQIN